MFVTRDALSLPLARLNSQSRLYQRFHNVWPKTSINGIEVYAKKLIFWEDGSYVESARMKKFVQALGMTWEQFTKEKMDSDLEEVFFKLKPRYTWDGSTRPGGTPEDPDEDDEAPTKEQIVEAINSKLKTGDEIVVTVSYGGSTHRYLAEHYMGWIPTGYGIEVQPLNSPVIRQILHSEPWFYFANIRDDGDIDQTVPWQTIKNGDVGDMPLDDHAVSRTLSGAPICDVASTISEWGIFALMGDTRTFEPIGDIFDEVLKPVSTLDGEALEYRYSQKYKFTEVDVESTIVEELYYRYFQIKEAHDSIYNGGMDTKAKATIASLVNDTRTNNLYYNGLLRVDAVAKMKRADFAEMLSKNLTTDYNVKEASTFEKVMAVVLVIVVIVIAWYAGGAVAGGWASLGGAGAGLATASLGLSIVSMIMSTMGMSAAGLSKRIGMMAEYVGIAAMVVGIWSSLTTAWSKATTAANAASATGTATTTQIAAKMVEQAVQSAVDSVTSAITNAMNSVGSFSLTDVVGAIFNNIDTLSKGVKAYYAEEQQKLQEEYKELQKEVEEYENQSNVFKDPLGAIYYIQNELAVTTELERFDRKYKDSVFGTRTLDKWWAERSSM